MEGRRMGKVGSQSQTTIEVVDWRDACEVVRSVGSADFRFTVTISPFADG